MSTNNIDKLIECARVYLSLTEPNKLLIKCCLCTATDLTDWTSFRWHLADRHAVGKFLVNPQVDLDEEIQAEVELEQQNLSKSCKDEFNVVSDAGEGIYSEAFEETYDERKTDDDSIQEQTEYHVINKPNQPFYSLLHTNPNLIFYFIQLIRQHEYLWNEKYRNMDFKAERSESAQQISKELFKRFNISIMPKVICYSVCTLLKWFEKQFAMLKNNPSFISRYPAYYEKLLAFVSTQNIHMLDCDECERRFYNEDQLRRHKYRVHCGSYPYVCDICNMGFSHACKLRMHKIRFHERSTRWQCMLCSYCAPNKWDYQLHLPTHTGERKFTCEHCGVTTKSISALAVHRRTHSNVKIKCPYCSKEFRENYQLKCHINKMHVEDLEEEFDQ